MIKILNAKLNSLFINFPKLVICFSLIATALITSGAKYVVQDDNMVNLLPDEIGSRKIFDEIQEDYGLTEYMYVAIGNKDVNIFNKKTLNTISNLSIEFESLDTVDDVISLTTLDKVYSDPLDSSVVIDDIINFPITNSNQIEDVVNYLEDNIVIKSRVVSQKNEYANIIIVPENSDHYVELSNSIHQITEKYNEQYEIHFGGQAYVTGAVPAMVEKEVKTLLLFGLILMAIILLLNLKSYKAVSLILLIIFSSLGAMFGFMGWVYHFTKSENFFFSMMNTSMPIVLLTIANSDGVHVVSRFFKELRKYKDTKEAVSKTIENLFIPIFLTSITTAAAFLMLIFSPVSSMIGYGFTIAFGIMWAWFLSNTLLPSLILLLKWDVKSKAIAKPSYIENIMNTFGNLVTTNPKKVLAMGVSITLFSAIGLFLITVEVQYTEMFRKGNPIKDSSIFLDDHLTGNVNVLLRVSSDEGPESLKSPKNLRDIEKIQNYLDTLNHVTSTISINDVVKQMHKVIEYDNDDYYTIPNSIEKVNACLSFYDPSGEKYNTLLNHDAEEGLITALMKTFSTTEVPALVSNINKFIDENIYNENKHIKFELTGMMIFIVDFTWLVIKSSAMSIILSLIIIFIISSLFFKSWRYGVLSIIPLLSAVILNFGLMGWFSIELTHLTALLSSIIIGVGVDFTIHYISEYQKIKEESNSNKNISKDTIDNVGYPIILDAWSNMAFGALLFSTIIPLAQIGGLMIFAMLATSIGALTLLASTIEIFKLKLK